MRRGQHWVPSNLSKLWVVKWPPSNRLSRHADRGVVMKKTVFGGYADCSAPGGHGMYTRKFAVIRWRFPPANGWRAWSVVDAHWRVCRAGGAEEKNRLSSGDRTVLCPWPALFALIRRLSVRRCRVWVGCRPILVSEKGRWLSSTSRRIEKHSDCYPLTSCWVGTIPLMAGCRRCLC